MVRFMVKCFLPWFIVISLATLLLDQISKSLMAYFQPHLKLGFFQITFITNTGAAFGILQNSTGLLTAISLAAAALLLFSYPKLPQQRSSQFLWALFLGGIVGNGLDRLLRGYVIDFLDFSFWPAFNLADSAITIAVIGLLIENLKENHWRKT